MRRLTLLFMLLAFCFSTNLSLAATATALTNAENSYSENLPKEKKTILEKFKTKVAKIAMKKYRAENPADVDIPGSAKTWLIYTLLLLIGAIVLYAVGIGTLGYIANGLAGIAFLIWILKYLKILD